MTHVLITGCNRGIGLALTKEALSRGFRVTGTARTGFEMEGVNVIACEMTDIDGISAALKGLEPLDLLINNAGVIGPDRQSTTDMDFNGFRRTLDINVLAPLAVSQACLPALRAAKGARILSISSQMSYMGLAISDRIAYRASKVALNKVMQGLATDLKADEIAVALVDPGWVQTDMGGAGADEDVDQVAKGILDLATSLTMDGTGKFYRFTGEERDF